MKEETKYNFSNIENLLLNMSAGLKPDNLNPNEIKMLVKKFGPNWKKKLGYK